MTHMISTKHVLILNSKFHITVSHHLDKQLSLIILEFSSVFDIWVAYAQYLLDCSLPSEGGLIVRHSARKRRLSRIGIRPTTLWEEGRGGLGGAGKAEGTKDIGERPREGRGLARKRDGGVSVDLEENRVQVHSPILTNLGRDGRVIQ